MSDADRDLKRWCAVQRTDRVDRDTEGSICRINDVKRLSSLVADASS